EYGRVRNPCRRRHLSVRVVRLSGGAARARPGAAVPALRSARVPSFLPLRRAPGGTGRGAGRARSPRVARGDPRGARRGGRLPRLRAGRPGPRGDPARGLHAHRALAGGARALRRSHGLAPPRGRPPRGRSRPAARRPQPQRGVRQRRALRVARARRHRRDHDRPLSPVLHELDRGSQPWRSRGGLDRRTL
ncbi:MAG: FHA domain containing protein, partial [uncultured Solirubrobacterales bacterium]